MIAVNPHLGELDDFIGKHKGLVYSIAIRCSYKTKLPVELDDLVQEGYIGLIKTYRFYDPSKGAMQTLAYSLIRNEVMDYIRDKLPIVRPPTREYALSGKILKARMQDASAEEISLYFNSTLAAAEKALWRVNHNVSVSLNATVHDHSGRAVEYWELFEHEDDLSDVEVNEFINKLTPQQIKVIKLLMEFNTKAETAREIGVTRTRVGAIVHQIEDRYLKYRRRWA
ncbi:sigma-70 family RNA polymerase sigma factor [Paenibacillus wynnii]|uniref:sigma-70 family RNA polymerase sigma factor n=1 Tax=Paenibacillus wynnii TaxID=268407 RepID=UPI00068AE1FF|nr:sigma-70 family RNA polymerase sigma factor [Paenibacillus wynnii]